MHFILASLGAWHVYIVLAERKTKHLWGIMKLPNSNNYYLRMEELNVNLYGVCSFDNLSILLLFFGR